MQYTKENILHTSTFNVTSAEIDMYKRLKIGSLVNFLIQAAVNSADELGFGYSNLQEHKLFWVLSRLEVDIQEPIAWYKKLKVQTWPKTVNRIFYYRDFLVTTETGKLVAKATSIWLAVDINTKRPKVLDPETTKIFHLLNDKHAIDTSLEKLTHQADNKISEQTTSYFDIDLNKHVTSTRYIDWVMDSFSEEYHKSNYPKCLIINYLKEIILNNKVAIYKQQNSDNEFILDGVNLNTDKTSFKAKIIF